jgi:outer membrane lipoprotein-sorting protein
MSASVSRPVRWIAPVVVAGVIAAGVAVPRLADASDAAAELPARTAAELLQAVSDAEVDGLSGTVVATSKLGLPELPSSQGGSAVSLPGLFAGSTTARVWMAGEDRSRIAVDAAFAEYDVVRDGSEVWTFDSASSDVTHLALPQGQEQASAPVEGAATPLDAAEQLLASVEPTTEVTVGTAAMVADRAAYEVVLNPRDAGTLVDTVRIASTGRPTCRCECRSSASGRPSRLRDRLHVRALRGARRVGVRVRAPPGSTVTERSIEPGKDAEAPEGAERPSR